MLRCADGSLYVGETFDVESRVIKHNEGGGGAFTSGRRPLQLVYLESCVDRTAALTRERQIKGWTRRKKEALITKDFELLKRL
jgi:predicted GIY-YIG superfamily endonuclease